MHESFAIVAMALGIFDRIHFSGAMLQYTGGKDQICAIQT
jgi:hypothetical protein